MRIHSALLPVGMAFLTFVPAFAATPAIGVASAQRGVILDGTPVVGNSTVFDGSTIQTEGYSRVQLGSATRVDLGAGSRVKMFGNHLALESGMSEVQSQTGYEIEARGLKILGLNKDSIARVTIDADRRVGVTALSGPVNVTSQGVLVARVFPSAPMSFLPQAAASDAFESTGCVLNKSGAAILVDDTGNQVSELRGMNMTRAVGRKTRIHGTVDSSATPAGGASRVVRVTEARALGTGSGCSGLAAKLGATTTAAGLGAAAGVGAGAAAAGAAAGATAGAAAGAAAATAAVSTAVVVAGVAVAAAAVGIGVAVASSGGSSTSP